MLNKNLGTQASSIAISPEGIFLVIGLINGVFIVFESEIRRPLGGNYHTDYSLPNLDVIMSPKFSKGAVAAIKFSSGGDFLAVSFNNEYRQEIVTLPDGKK